MRLGLPSLLLWCTVWACGHTRQRAPSAETAGAEAGAGGAPSPIGSSSGGTNDIAGGGGAPSSTAGAPASQAGEAGQGGGAGEDCSAQVVNAVGRSNCLTYEVLTASCFAPPSQSGHYAPVAAWATDPYPDHKLRGGRRSFFSAGYFRDSGTGWEASPYCMPDGPFMLLAFDDESSVTTSRGALGGTWDIRVNGEPLLDGLATPPSVASVSGATLILDGQFYARAGAAFSPLPQALPWQSSKVIGLGSDRFARLVDDSGDMELTRRVGSAWVAFGHVPASDDASMTPDGVTPAHIAINSHNGASVYKQDQAGWTLEQSFAPSAVASLGSRGDTTTLVVPDAGGVHVSVAGKPWREIDLLPLTGAQALAGEGVVIVETSDPKYLAKLPELSPGRAPGSLVVVYASVP